MFIKVRIGKSTSVLLTLQIAALGPPLTNPCCRCAAQGGLVRGSCDNGCRLAKKVTYVCAAAHFTQSASALKSEDTGLT
jgi:hypothetical protein